MNRRAVGLLLFAIIAITACFVFGVIYSNWAEVSKSFYDVKVTDVASLVVTVALGILVSYIISNYLSNDKKKKELFMSVYMKLEDLLQDVYQIAQKYISRPTAVRADEIKKEFKNISRQINLVRCVSEQLGVADEAKLNTLENSFFKLKATITDGTFGTARPRYTEQEIVAIGAAYEELSLEIMKRKLDLFK